MKRRLLLVTLFCFGMSCVLFAQAKKLAPLTKEVVPSSSIKASPNSARVQAAEVAKQHVVTSYGQLPLSFEANQGQTDPQVRFLSRGSGYTLFLTPTEAVLSLREPQEKPSPISRQLIAEPENVEKMSATVLRIKLVGANPTPEVQGLNELPGKSNYFIGSDPKKWRRNVPAYVRVKYHAVYHGIDLIYHGDQGLEHDFIVAPGASPEVIRFAIAGAGKLRLDSQGDLVVRLSNGELRLHKPIIYQVHDDLKQAVEGRYVLRTKNEIGFEVGRYDASKPLTIDPALNYLTYLGGTSEDRGNGIAVDSSGNAYVTGLTFSPNFPTTTGAMDRTCGTDGNCNQTSDAFVAKIDPSKSGSASLVYSTYLGGSGNDAGMGMAVDGAGNAYVTGAGNLSSDFPTTPNAFVTTCSTCTGFLAKLNTDGSNLLYSTYLPQTSPTSVAVDSSGNAYVTGGTSGGLLTKPSNAFQPSLGGGNDAFALKIDPTQSGSASLIYSTYIGGNNVDFGRSIAVDSSGNAYVTGETLSSNFPTTTSAFDRTCGSDGGCDQLQFGFSHADVFVTKLNATGTGILYSTYLGGSGIDLGQGIAVDAAGNAYVTGRTSSTNFPTTPGAFQTSFIGSEDVFVAKIDPSQSGSASLVYATYLGGGNGGADAGQSIAVDASGRVYVTGFTASGNFPTTGDAFQPGSLVDAFVAKIDPSQSGSASLVYSTHLGGNGSDFGNGVAVSDAGDAYVTGQTLSSDLRTTSNAFQASPAGGSFGDAFVAKISLAMDDNFNENSLNPNRWQVLSPPPGSSVTVTATNQRLEVTMGPGAGGGGIVSVCSVAGDFDAQVDYILLNWPSNNSHSVRLGAFDLGVPGVGAVGMNRSSFSSELYILQLLDQFPQTSSADTSGKLRLVRTGSTLSGFFFSGTGWVLLGSGAVSTAPTHFNLDLGTNDPSAPGGVLIAFDNFRMNAGTISCPRPTPPPPSITSIDPGFGIQSQTTRVTITGNNFQSDTSLKFSGDGIDVNIARIEIQLDSAHSARIFADVTVAVDAPLTIRDVIVTNPDGQAAVLKAGFRVVRETQIAVAPALCAAGECTNPSEPYVAVDPNDSLHAVAGYNGEALLSNPCPWAESRDGGSNWTNDAIPLPQGFGFGTDPWVRYTPSGELFYSCLANKVDTFTNGSAITWKVFVARSGTGLASNFEQPVVAVAKGVQHCTSPTTCTGELLDHPSLGVLRKDDGSVVLVECWTVFQTHPSAHVSQEVFTAASLDGGRTWLPKASVPNGNGGSNCTVGSGKREIAITFWRGNLMLDTSRDGRTWFSSTFSANVGTLILNFQGQGISTSTLVVSAPYTLVIPGPNADLRAIWQTRQDINNAIQSRLFIGDSSSGWLPVVLPPTDSITQPDPERFLPGAGSCADLVGAYERIHDTGDFRYNVWLLSGTAQQGRLGAKLIFSSSVPFNGTGAPTTPQKANLPIIGDYTSLDCSQGIAWATWTDRRSTPLPFVHVNEIWGAVIPFK